MWEHVRTDGWMVFALLHPILINTYVRYCHRKLRPRSTKVCLPPREQLYTFSFCRLLILCVQLETAFIAVGSKFRISSHTKQMRWAEWGIKDVRREVREQVYGEFQSNYKGENISPHPVHPCQDQLALSVWTCNITQHEPGLQ